MTPTEKLYQDYKDKPKGEREELISMLELRAKMNIAGHKFPFGTFVPTLKQVYILGVKLETISVNNKPAECAAEYVNV